MTRLAAARAGIDHTKQVMSQGAGNQYEALEDTNFNSYFRMAAMRDPECWILDPNLFDLANQYPDALTAAKADLAAGGNCGEHAMVAFDYLRTRGGHTVNRADKSGLDHAFVILGDIGTDSDADLVVCDPWPTAPTACLWEDHFGYTPDPGQLNTRNTASAEDTEDIKAILAQGLRLSAKGEEMIQYAFDEERTKEELEKGTSGDKPWIWNQVGAASTEYTYVEEAPPEQAPEQAPEAEAPAEEEQVASGGGEQSGWQRFISWLRSFL
jgi:hypothetical protein